MTQLQFIMTAIASKLVLPLLSNYFPYLDYLKFDTCKYDTSSNIISIFLTSTAVGTMDVQDDGIENKITGSLILLIVNLQDQNIKRYYMNVLHTEVKDTQDGNADRNMEIDNDIGNEENDDDDDEDYGSGTQQVLVISKMVYENLKTTTKVQDVTAVTIHLKSLKKLVLSLDIRYSKREITLTFP